MVPHTPVVMAAPRPSLVENTSTSEFARAVTGWATTTVEAAHKYGAQRYAREGRQALSASQGPASLGPTLPRRGDDCRPYEKIGS